MSEIPDVPRIPVGTPSSESSPKVEDAPHRPKIAEYRRCFEEAEDVVRQYVSLATERNDAVEKKTWTSDEVANTDLEIARLRTVRDRFIAKAAVIMLSAEYQDEVAAARKAAQSEIQTDVYNRVAEVLEIYERIRVKVLNTEVAATLTLAVCTRSRE